MKFIKLYTGIDNKSYFTELESTFESIQHLGSYSKKYPVKNMIFRDFEKDAIFDWHTAPQVQYIIYLEGEVEVKASGGEKRVFKAGHVLLAADLTGQGHVTKTLTKGKSIIVTVYDIQQ
jgi:hypothetical protein